MSKAYADQNARKKKKDEQNSLGNAVKRAAQTTTNTVKQATTQNKPRTSASQEYLNSRRDMARNAGAEVANSVNNATRRNQQYINQSVRRQQLQKQAKTDTNVATALEQQKRRQANRQQTRKVQEQALLDRSNASRKMHENATVKTAIGSLEQSAGGHLKTIGDNANRHSYSMYKDWVNNEVATGRMSEEEGKQYLKNLEASPAAKNYEKWQNSGTRKVFSKIYETGTKLNEMGDRNVQEAAEGAKGLKKAYLGAVNSGVGMLTDMAAGPAWALSMYSRTYGNNRGQVEALGGTTAQDMTNAGLQALKETATEHLFMGVGLARGLANRGMVKGMSIADRVGAKILAKAEGRTANFLSGLGRVATGTFEENAEELAGWALDPLITEIAYGGDLRKKEAREMLKEQSARLLDQFPDENSARAAALFVGSDEFIEQNKKSYMESGLPEKESQALAETMQEYMIAALSNDTETMLEKEQEMIKFMSGAGGISKDSWSLKELGETFASTTLLTATTGIPSAITTSQVGTQYQSQQGKDAVQALAKTAINLDPEMSAKAQAMQDRMDAGKDLTGTQVYDLMVSAQKAIQETSERANTAMQVAKKGVKDENLIDPVTAAENGSIELGKITDQKYDEDVDNTLALIDEYNASTEGEEERLQLREEDKELVADAVAAFNAGVLTPDHVYVLSRDNQAARNVFTEATGIDLNQYDVYDKKGNLDVVQSNINMQDALFAQAAQNYIESARAETAQWENEERGDALTSVSQRMESNGVTAVNNALLGVDARDRGRYLMTLRTADSVYHAARNTGEEWDDTKREFIQRIAPDADIDALRAVYDAGLMDREASEDVVRGKVVQIGKAIKADNKANSPAPMLKVNMHSIPTGSMIGLFSNIVNITQTSIVLSDSLGADINGTYVPETDTIYLNVTKEGYAARNIGYTFMHEFTHHLQEYAPEEYQALKDAVRQRWEEKDPDGFKARIAAKIEQYKGYEDLTEDRAIDELIADGVHEFLNDEQFVEKICDENPSLAKSIINAIRNVLRKLRQLFGMTTDPMYKQAIFSQLDMLSEAEELWLRAFQAAVKNKAEAGLIKWDEQARSRLMLVGRDADGTEIYETSEETKKLSWKERKDRAIDLMTNQYRNRTAKFIRDGVPYYAKFDKADVKKNLYGDSKSSNRGRDAKVNVAADGQLFELVEHSKQSGKPTDERGKRTKQHRDVDKWEYYVKDVAVDGVYYKELINVRRLPNDDYVYEINLWEDEKKEDIVPTKALDIYKDKKRALKSEATLSSDETISPSGEKVKYSIPDYTQEDMDAHRQTLIDEVSEYYDSPYTNNYDETGWIFPDGKMLRMGMDGMRGEDHRIARHAYDDNITQSEGLHRFNNEGNIRFNPESNSLEFGTGMEPTTEQYAWIEKMVNRRGISMIEFTDLDNESADYRDYEMNEEYPSGYEVVQDIKRFYREGKVGGSEVNQFRYSLSEETVEKVEADIGPMVRFSMPTYREIEPKAMYKSGVGFADYFMHASGRDLTYRLTKYHFSEEQAKAVVSYLDKMADWFERTDQGSLQSTYRFIGWNDLTDATVQVKRNDADEIIGVTVSAMIKNSEYPVNFDFTTVCNKREGISNVIKNLMNTSANGSTVLNSIKLTDENMWRINQALKAEGIDTACLGCFVEARRYYAQSFMDKIEEKWNKAVRKARKELGLPEDVFFDFTNGRKATGEEYSSIDSLWTAYDESTESKKSPADRIKILMDEIVRNKDVNSPYLKQISIADILTPEGINGFKQLSNQGHDMVKTIKSIYGTSAPKEILAFTPYNSEIALLPDEMKGMETSEYLKSIGGIRVQSFSDFKIEHTFEHFQMVADEAARGFYTHGYSKVIAFPRIFGLTGRKLNMSVMFDVLSNKAWSQALGIPVRKAAKYAKKYQGLQFVRELPKTNEDGRPYKEVEIEGVHGYLTYLVSDADYVNSVFNRLYRENIDAGMTEEQARRAANEAKPFEQSINYREAVELENQDGYKENVGIIAVAYGDEHLKMLLADPNVRYIIPYHKSGLPTFISKKTALAIARDYTNFQNTNIAESWKDSHGKDIDLKAEYAAFKKNSKADYPAIEFFKQINDNKYKVKFGSKDSKQKAEMAGTADFDVYQDLETVSDIREISNAYLEHCINKGWCPIFHEFAGDHHYYKMLFDFAVTDGGFKNIFPQKKVRNKYPGLDIDAKVAAGEAITDVDLEMLKEEIRKGAETQNNKNMTMASNMQNVMNDILTRGSENSIIDDTNLQSIRWGTPDYTDVKLGNEDVTLEETGRDIKLSLVENFDDAYMDAVNSDDMEEAQRLVEQAAERAGYDRLMYHQTPNVFTQFDISRNSNSTGENLFPFGIFTKSSNRDIGIEGSIQMPLYVKASRILSARDRDDMKRHLPSEYSDIVDQLKSLAQKYGSALDELEDRYLDAEEAFLDANPNIADEYWNLPYPEREQFEETFDDEDFQNARKSYNDLFAQWVNEENSISNEGREYVTNWLEQNGYDGFYVDVDEGSLGRKTDTLVLLNRNQVKSAETVTYAEDGSVIPLSERFDPDNNDIRYSLPTQDADGNILSDGQMEFFKDSQARDEQGRLVPVYHTTNNGGFTIFDPSFSDDHRSLFFASSLGVSLTYADGYGEVMPFDVYNSEDSIRRVTLNDIIEEDSDFLYYTLLDDYSISLVDLETGEVLYNSADNLFDTADALETWDYKAHLGLNDADETTGVSIDGGEVLKYREFQTWLSKIYAEKGAKHGYYSCYLNLENPLVIEGRGQEWNHIVDGGSKFGRNAYIEIHGKDWFDREAQFKDEMYEMGRSLSNGDSIRARSPHDNQSIEITLYAGDDGDHELNRVIVSKDSEEDIANVIGEYFNLNDTEALNIANDLIANSYLNSVRLNDSKLRGMLGEYGLSTREWAEYAAHNGYDGVIFRDIIDLGPGETDRETDISDIYIAFSGNQVKDTRNQNPTKNPDIRYSIPPEEDVFAALAEEYDDVEEIPASDPVIEEGRVRMAKSKQDFINSIYAKWNERWFTEGKILDTGSVEKQVRALVMATMQHSDTGRQYKQDLVKMTVRDAKIAFKLMRESKYKEATDVLWKSALNMIEGVEFFEDDMDFEIYKDIRRFLRTYPITLDERFYKDVDYGAFRKRNRGKLRLVRNGTPVDEVYQELEEQWPGIFDSEVYITPADRLLHIEEVIQSNLDPYRKAYTSEEAAKEAWSIASDLYDIIFEEGTEYRSIADTFKAKYDKQAKALKARHEEAMRKVQENNEKALAKEQQKTEAQKQKAEQWKKKYAEEKKAERERRENARTAKEHAKHFGRILRNYDWLSKRLLDPTKDKNIPEQFRSSLAHMLQAFDLQTVRSKALEEKFGVAKKTIAMRELRDRYEEISKEDESGPFVYNGYLFELMKAMSNKIDGKTIDELDIDDLASIDTLLAAIVHNFRNYNKVRLQNKQIEIEDIGGKTIDILRERIDKYGMRKTYGPLRGGIDRLVNEGEETPIYFFERIDPTGDGIGAMYKELRRGEDKHIRNMQFLRERFDEICGDYYNRTKRKGMKLPGSELEKWRDSSQAKTYDLANGSITLTPAQIMSLYCLSKRAQAMGHILGNGIVASPVTFGQKMGEKLKGKVNRVSSVLITYEEVQTIIKDLSKEQKEMADQLQSLLANEMAAWGNETSMEMYGIKLFKDKDYFPIRSSREVLAKQADSFDVQEKIKNFGFTKPLEKGAKNAIAIDDIFSVVADHCNKMSLYNAMAVPISDFMRVYNYKQENEDGSQTAVQAIIGDAFTRKANDYIMKFIADVNGNTKTRSDAVDDLMNKALANYKKASIGANARVALQQPTAIFRAFMVLDPKYFAGVRPNKKETQEMFDHCPIALWKSWGHYDMDMGRDVEDIMMNNDWSIGDDLTMGIYGSLDNMTWGMIWQAVKKEVKEKHPDVEVGSDEFFELCNERASEVFDKTQVVDSIFHRSDTMRSKNTLTKMAVSFMAEPTLTFNVLRDSLVKANEMWKDGDKSGAMKLFNRMAAVLALNAAAVSASAALWDAVRGKGDDDDDKKGFWELWYLNFVENFKDNINMINNIYFVKDIVGIKEGIERGFGGTSNMALEGFETFFTGWNQAKKKLHGESDKGWYDICMNLLGGLGYITGVPVKTTMRDAKAIFKKFGIEVFAADSLEEKKEEKTPVAFIKDGTWLDNLLNRYGWNLTKKEAQLKKAKEKEGTKDVKTGVSPQEYEKIMEQAKEEGFTGDEYNKRVAQLISEKSTGVEITVKEEKTDTNTSSGSLNVPNQKQAAFNNLKSLEEKALTKAEGKTGREKADILWDIVGDNYTHYVNIADWEYLNEMRSFLEKNGGDVNAFDQKVLDAAKVAYKKTLVEPELVPIELQRELYEYMTEHGVSQNYISSNILYKSYTASDLKAAFRMGNREYIEREASVLIAAGLTREDFDKLYKYRNYGAKSYKGKYSDPKYSISTGKYRWPATGEVTSGFGYRGSVAGTNPNHRGIDIGGNIGDPVTAADGGTVIAVNYGYNGGYGNQIKIRHDDGTITWYNHLSGANVRVGDTVGQGSQIGQIGATGAVTGPHLDFMVEVNGEYVDPLTYLKA